MQLRVGFPLPLLTQLRSSLWKIKRAFEQPPRLDILSKQGWGSLLARSCEGDSFLFYYQISRLKRVTGIEPGSMQSCS